ncbi:NADH-quinone oxidoreductase subunit N [Moraxella bovis]|uniref:NADH-quinone oxidoreductase subunit N n=1 Tax=Moraxella bovis TaxID=476 RepID=UPI0022276558|nr:NADH-quinone oxidoreductase subunit N [Moraxella bovis]UZA09365.1 NADH-quinone oxidoreductase subunit N [Moraxella bovis]UZA36341.1 NADH-quinone oxidoreductase subunit N [Moraxella bovis]
MNVSIEFSFLLPLLPAMILGVAVLVVMLAIAIKRSHSLIVGLTALGLNGALVVLLLQFFEKLPTHINRGDVMGLFLVDGFALFNSLVVVVSALACVTLSYRYFQSFNNNKEELYLLLLTSTLGAVLMTSAHHFASFFVSLELLSVPMYGMLSFAYLKQKSLESGLKYLILSATASATLLMGMAFIFGATGELGFVRLGQSLMAGFGLSPLFMVGAVMMVAAVAFKLSLAPFHSWAGDIYQGSPAPVTAFLASVGKVAVVALVVRFLLTSATPAISSVDVVLVALVLVSIVAGNLLALTQTNLKRLLAFSSVAHMGYVLIPLIATGTTADADSVISMYMLIYALSSVGAFGVIVLMTGAYGETNRNTATQEVEDEADSMAVYQGLFWRRPVLTAVLTVMILSMAGIPFTAGFITKMQVLFAATQGGRFGLAFMVIVGSAIGLYYYLKVLLIMFKRPMTIVPFDVPSNWRVKAGGLVLILITVFIFVMGILPNTLFKWASMAILSL